jgi:putative ABC transport system permease protein
VAHALRGEGVTVVEVLGAPAVRRSPTLAALTWTFGFMAAVGVAIGAIAVLSILLYLQSRQRSRLVAYAMARRMGLRRGAHLLSLVFEAAGLLALAYAIGTALGLLAGTLTFGRVDPLPSLPPAMTLRAPLELLGASALALALAACLGALGAQRRADRMDVAAVMRVAD